MSRGIAWESGLKAIVGARLSRSMDTLVRRAIRPLIGRASSAPLSSQRNGRRFVILHLDGVSLSTLLYAIHRGYAPFLERLIRSSSYQLTPAYSGAPASTPAFQAGLLYGARDADIPGFNWLDRRLRREIRMDRSRDALAVESLLQNRACGLLRQGSASFSVFTGEAPVNGYCRAGWAAERLRFLGGEGLWNTAAAVVAHSLTASRVIGRLFREGGAALLDLFRQIFAVGRLQHEPTFLLHRVGLAIGAREAATWGTVLDIARGVPALYTCFGDYDEIAHRRGPDSAFALLALWGIDRALARIMGAAAAVPQLAYDFFIVSDHGQVETLPFEKIAGLRLADYLKSSLQRAKDKGQCLRQIEDTVIIEAGDMAHIYLGGSKSTWTIEEIERYFPDILTALVNNPVIGIVAARGATTGIAFFNGMKLDLTLPSDLQVLDVGYGGQRTGSYLSHLLQMPSSGDLIVYGNGLPDRNVAFAWEFGSHAGVAKQEVETFVIHPSHWAGDLSQIEHGADIHDFLVDTYMK